MYIDFSPSAKTLKKIEKIAKLREQNVKWEVIAKRVGNKVRYCQALQEYYLKVMEGKIK